jgi:hypothetical protein
MDAVRAQPVGAEDGQPLARLPTYIEHAAITLHGGDVRNQLAEEL